MSAGLQGLHLHLDPTSGIAGDMFVAALVDAGVPPRIVTKAVGAMGVKGLRTGFDRRKRGAYAARGFVVRWPGERKRKSGGDHEHEHEQEHEHEHGEHRDYGEIKQLLGRAGLEKPARKVAEDIFGRLARVEGRLHGVRPDRVTFHEVGAYDSIADVVGAAAALAWLRPASVTSTPPVLGTGTVRTAHGIVPVPAPATAEILRGIPVRSGGVGELTTPTGAAVLAAIVNRFEPAPPMRLIAVGYGGGDRELSDRPNVLRAVLGELLGRPEPAPPSEVEVIEANLDDMSPQLVGPLLDALFAAGALDAWCSPIVMKKGRPALQVSAMAPVETSAVVQSAFFRHSTTLGLRIRRIGRTVLARSFDRVETRWGSVRVKLAVLEGEVLAGTPEFDDCRRLAASAGVPVKDVLADAAAAARRIAGRGRRARR